MALFIDLHHQYQQLDHNIVNQNTRANIEILALGKSAPLFHGYVSFHPLKHTGGEDDVLYQIYQKQNKICIFCKNILDLLKLIFLYI